MKEQCGYGKNGDLCVIDPKIAEFENEGSKHSFIIFIMFKISGS
jgi:hypothetical protein